MTDVTTADDRRWRGAMRGERPATDVAAGRTRRADLEALLHDLEQAAADRAPRGVALSDEVKARIEYLHDQVRDATDRCQRKFVPKADRQRVREALAAERVALDELGFDSYSAFVLVTTAPAAAGPADEFPPGFHARITALVGPGCASIAEALTAVRTELTAMPPAPAAPPPIAPVAPAVALVAPAVAPDVGEPPLAAEPPVAAVAEASAPVSVAPCAPAAPTPSADEPPAPQAAAGDAPTDQEATMTVTDDTRTADFATLFAHLQDAASAVVAGVA